MGWCEANGVDFCSAWPKISALGAEIAAELRRRRARISKTSGQPARRFTGVALVDARQQEPPAPRVVAKAEHLDGGEANPRFVVTSLSSEDADLAAAPTRRFTAPAATWRIASRSARSVDK